MATTATRIPLVKEFDRVPSMTVPLGREQEARFQRLMETTIMVDLHQHPMVLPESLDDFPEYLRSNDWRWGYQATRHGGWTAICTANILSVLAKSPEVSFARFADLVDEVGLMLADLARQGGGVAKIGRAGDIVSAKQQNRIGFLPTVEHLAIDNDLHRIEVLYGLGVRLAGLTYSRRNYIGDGQNERNDGGLSEFGVEVVRRMNDLGMAVDVSHASFRTAMDAIEHSRVPIAFSHNAAYAIRPTRRARKDEELLACARKGGIIGITAVPNALSDAPDQDINCVLDHYDHMVKLVGADHVAIGTDTLIGDHVGLHVKLLGRDRPAHKPPAPYLNGLESPAEGKNIIRGLIARGYGDEEIKKIAGQNAVDFFRRVIG
ncbi:MAG: membrane dipeptidase [Chloroflexi bacterium]|nr:membrane dipeptidase [Chloroflexota bacterium]